MTEGRFEPRSIGYRAIDTLVGVSLIAALWSLRSYGPDFDRYLGWAAVALSGNLFALPTDILSPAGLPGFQWSYGPGFLFAIPGYLGAPPRAAALAVGFLFGLVLWPAMFRVLLLAANGNRSLALFGTLAAFLGTHLGYYSHVHASESLAAGVAALLAALLFGSPASGRWSTAGIGCLAALLVVIRSQLAIYAILAVAVHGFRHRRLLRSPNRLAGLLFATTLLLPLAIAIGAGLIANGWATGEPGTSPYRFGDDQFSSLDPGRPEIAAVLLHPWHGLLAYHPLYGLGFAAMLACAASPRVDGAERFLWGALATAFSLHLFVNASWYCWWLGTGTFGMRGMAITGVFIAPAILRLATVSSRRRLVAILMVTLGACTYSSVLLWLGNSNFPTAEAFLSGIARQAGDLNFAEALAWSACTAAIAGAIGASRGRSDADLAFCCGLLGGMLASYLGWMIDQNTRESAIAGAAYAAWISGRKPIPRLFAKRNSHQLAAAGAILCLALVLVPFARVAWTASVHQATGGPPPRNFKWMGNFQYDEAEASYREYLRVTGFDDNKRRLRAFLDGARCDPAPSDSVTAIAAERPAVRCGRSWIADIPDFRRLDDRQGP